MINPEPEPTPPKGIPTVETSTNRLNFIINVREIARLVLTALALCGLIYSLYSRNANDSNFFELLDDFRAERLVEEKRQEDEEECVRRYEQAVETVENRQIGLLSEFIVIIYLYPPNTPERKAGAEENITELDQVNAAARQANADKVEYDNLGHPLPCPIGPKNAP